MFSLSWGQWLALFALFLAALEPVLDRWYRRDLIKTGEALLPTMGLPDFSFPLPPELSSSQLPRKVKLNKLGKVELVLSLFIVAILPFWIPLEISITQRRLEEERLLASEAVHTSTPVRGTSDLYKTIYVRYQVDSSRHFEAAKLPKEIFDTVHEGSIVAVSYARSKPSVGRVDAQIPEGPIWPEYLPILLSLGVLILPWRLWRHRRLLATGEAVCAVVSHVDKSKRIWRVVYHYRGENGETVSGVGKVSAKSDIEVNNGMVVIFDPASPKRSMLYPLRTVELV